MTTQHHSQRGLSLIELMVALALGGILMGGAITLFINNRATYEVTNDMARLQENARYALQVMTEDIRMAGHTGCVNVVAQVNNMQEFSAGFTEGQLSDFGRLSAGAGSNAAGERNGSNAIEGFESANNAWMPSGFAAPASVANSDGITVRYIAGDRTQGAFGVNTEALNASNLLVGPTNDASDQDRRIYVRDLTDAPNNGQALALSDCGAADVFRAGGFAQDAGPTLAADGVTRTDVVTASRLSRSYTGDRRPVVAPLVGIRYFVANNAAGVPALFRSTIDPNNSFAELTEELVDGVHSLQILYGFDVQELPNDDRIADVYLRADEATVVNGTTLTLNDVTSRDVGRHDGIAGLVSVKIGLLMQTVDEFGDVPDDVVFDVLDARLCHAGIAAANGCTAFPTDRRRRRVFQTTVTLRNFQ